MYAFYGDPCGYEDNEAYTQCGLKWDLKRSYRVAGW